MNSCYYDNRIQDMDDWQYMHLESWPIFPERHIQYMHRFQ
ncbi:unnamed protein product [Schistosoma mattheei]|uniref:SAM-dependent methyltransferase n=2 Tax=Schistosoma TaxID=6181 RepID=A0A183L2F2_9TREM|nr:unnamed protein product [Schistosoma mattheei]VDP75628.1 unnamed protein product [Schistosoma curassoni]